MKSEKDVKAAVKQVLDDIPGVWYFMPAANGYGAPGIPDFLGCYAGHMFAIECKFGPGTQTMWQKKQANAITVAGAPYMLINEHNVNELAIRFSGWIAICL